MCFLYTAYSYRWFAIFVINNKFVITHVDASANNEYKIQGNSEDVPSRQHGISDKRINGFSVIVGCKHGRHVDGNKDSMILWRITS